MALYRGSIAVVAACDGVDIDDLDDKLLLGICCGLSGFSMPPACMVDDSIFGKPLSWQILCMPGIPFVGFFVR